MSGWGKKLAETWTNNVPPSRPSCSEICVYTSYLRRIQSAKKERIKLLVLGSTPEFRDWGYEENLDITVVDKSEEYYQAISREIRHKNIKEKLIISLWEDMELEEEYDIIIGDLAVGNIDGDRLDDFLKAVSSALLPGGYFIGKSFLWADDELVKTPHMIIEDYFKAPQMHPYTFINHQLGLYCLDKQTFQIDFTRMFNEMIKLLKEGVLDQNTFSYFENVGWNTEMKFTFFAPSQDYFREHVEKYMKFKEYVHTSDIYTCVFPIYIITK